LYFVVPPSPNHPRFWRQVSTPFFVRLKAVTLPPLYSFVPTLVRDCQPMGFSPFNPFSPPPHLWVSPGKPVNSFVRHRQLFGLPTVSCPMPRPRRISPQTSFHCARSQDFFSETSSARNFSPSPDDPPPVPPVNVARPSASYPHSGYVFPCFFDLEVMPQ